MLFNIPDKVSVIFQSVETLNALNSYSDIYGCVVGWFQWFFPVKTDAMTGVIFIHFIFIHLLPYSPSL